MSQFSEMLIYLRKRAGYTQEELADKIGVKRSAVGMYELAKREPPLEALEAIADVFNVDMNTLTGSQARLYPNGTNPMPSTLRVPRLGVIACGEPVLAEQNVEDYDEVPDFVKCDFTLVCDGDSMTGARINSGDVVCIKLQDTVENGQIAAVLVDDGGESAATLKRVRFIDGGVALLPENPAYEPKFFTGESARKVRILGLATHFISKVM